MMKKKRRLLLICVTFIFMLVGCAQKQSDTEDSVTKSTETVAIETAAIKNIVISDEDLKSATKIILSGQTAEVEGEGASFLEDTGTQQNSILIEKGGIYNISGTFRGRIVVDADGKEVILYLNEADITCDFSAPIYAYDAKSVVVYLAEGTQNSIADGDTYMYTDTYSNETEEDPNACLYSKTDLYLCGEGLLEIVANTNNAITGKDALQISDVTLAITAANHGINGKDSCVINNADITIDSADNAIRSTNDTDETLGYVSITDSNIQITTEGKGIQGTTAVILHGGDYVIDSTDDSIHSNGDVMLSEGDYTLSSEDDGIHADGTLTISGGELVITKSYEGLEGSSIEIIGGTIDLTASDDGLNAAGGVDSSGFGGMDAGEMSTEEFGGGMFAGNDSMITISGGNLTVNADGDGIDSNGDIIMAGGTVTVYGPTDGGNGSLDYGGTFTLSGGTLLAQESAAMTQVPNDVSQYMISVTFDRILAAGSEVIISGSNMNTTIQIEKQTQNFIYSSPALEQEITYSIMVDGSEITSLTLQDYITTYGNAQMGGNMNRGDGGMYRQRGTAPSGEVPTE